MPDAIKIIIKDKFSNKLIALKLKEDTTLVRVIDVLKKRYEHLQDKEILLVLHGEELALELTLQDLVDKKNYTEKDRIEIEEKQAAASNVLVAEEEPNFVEMMRQGGEQFDNAIMEILVRRNVILPDVADNALNSSRQTKRSFVTTLIEDAYLSEKDILTNVSKYLEIPSVDLEGMAVASDLLTLIPKKEAEYYCAMPIRREQNALSVAMINPFDAKKLHDLKLLTGLNIQPTLSTEPALRNKIKQLYSPRPSMRLPQITPEKAPEKAPEKTKDASALSDDFFAARPATGQKGPLVIRDGKKVDNAKEIAEEEYNYATLCADKDEVLKPLDLEDESEKSAKASSPIWDAPTLAENQGQEQPPTSDFQGFDIAPEIASGAQDMQGLEIAPDLAQDAQFPDAIAIDATNAEPQAPDAMAGFDIEPEVAPPANDLPGLDMNTGSAVDQDDNSPAQGADANGIEISADDAALGGAIPIYSGLDNEEIPQAIEVAAPVAELPAGDLQLELLPEIAAELPKTEIDEEVPAGQPTPNHDDLETLPQIAVSPTEDATANTPPLDNLAFSNKELEDIENLASFTPGLEGLEDVVPASRNAEKTVPTPRQTAEKKAAEHAESAPAATAPADYQFQSLSADLAENDGSSATASDLGESPTGQDSDLQKTFAKPPAIPTQIESPAIIEMTGTTTQKLETAKTRAEELLGLQDRLASQMETVKTQAQSLLDTHNQLRKTVVAIQETKEQQTQEAAAFHTQSEPAKKAPAKFSRSVIVRYFRSMHPAQTVPLTVLFSQLKQMGTPMAGVAQVEGKPVTVKREQPVVKLVPQIPGCLTIPNELSLDISPEESRAKFWITALTEGNIEEGQVQIWYQDKCLQSLPIALKVVKQWPAKLSVACGFLFPMLSFMYEIYGGLWLERVPKLVQHGLNLLPKAAEPVGGILNLGLAIGGGFMLLAMLLAFMRRAKQGAPVKSIVTNGE